MMWICLISFWGCDDGVPDRDKIPATVSQEYTSIHSSDLKATHEGKVKIRMHHHLLNIVHNTFCDLFLRFGDIWVVANPKEGVMAFPRIFETFQMTIRKEYPVL